MYASIIALATAVSTVAALPQVGLPPANTTTPTNTTTPIPAANGTNIDLCGTQPYYQSNYTCYNNQYLCPVINNRRTQACGEACFDPAAYNCVNGQLEQVASGAFLNGTIANSTAQSGDGVAAPVPVNTTVVR